MYFPPAFRRGGLITWRVMGGRWQSPSEQGGLEVPCELTFPGTEQLTKNMHVHVSTITGWVLARMSTRASRSKGEGWALTRVSPQITRNAKNGGGCLPGRIRYYSRRSQERSRRCNVSGSVARSVGGRREGFSLACTFHNSRSCFVFSHCHWRRMTRVNGELVAL